MYARESDMYLLNDLLSLEGNYLISAIVGGATALISVLMLVLAVKKKHDKIDAMLIAGLAVTFACCVVSTLFCYNILVVVGYLVSLISLTAILCRTCIAYHINTIYDVEFKTLFLKMLFPVSVIGMMFRPWFVETKGAWYSLMAVLGLDSPGTYAFDVTVVEPGGRGITTWNIISVIEILLFIALITMQLVLIWRLFIDPDNAKSFSMTGMLITVILAAFIYGVYTSPNFNIATISKYGDYGYFDMDTYQYVDFVGYKVVASNTDNITAIPFAIAILGALNYLLYLEPVEQFMANINRLPSFFKEKIAAKKAKAAKANVSA